jgi:hypothetical protein
MKPNNIIAQVEVSGTAATMPEVPKPICLTELKPVLEERYGRRSTMITSQLPADRWHEIIGDPTYADAILDRVCTENLSSGVVVVKSAKDGV